MIVRNAESPGAPMATMHLSSMQRMNVVEQYGIRSVTKIRQKASKQAKPLVGFSGIRNSIAVERRPDGVKCRVSTRSYLFVLAGTGLFGPVLGSIFYLRPLEQHTPSYILGAVWLLIFLSSFVFIRYLLGCPRFTADYGTGEILYFKWWGSKPSLVLRREEIRNVEVEERSFLDEGTRVPNFCLTVTTSQDKQYALCVSTDQQLIGSLRSDLENARFGRI
jgi:hypothetical protein